MTDAPIATKEHPAPLDAFDTAKPDEPIFTLQGGDPLAASLVRLWAFFARVRTGLRYDEKPVVACLTAALGHSVADDERETQNLLVRATAAEAVSWAMDDYVKGNRATDRPTEAQDTHLNELQRIDLHDLRVRVAQKLSNFRCEIIEMREALGKAGYDTPAAFAAMSDIDQRLLQLNEAIEPRRLFKKDQ